MKGSRTDPRIVRFLSMVVTIFAMQMLREWGLSLSDRFIIFAAFAVVYVSALYEGSRK